MLIGIIFATSFGQHQQNLILQPVLKLAKCPQNFSMISDLFLINVSLFTSDFLINLIQLMYFRFHKLRIFTFSVMNHLWKHCSDTLSSLAFETDSITGNFWPNSSSEEQSTRPQNSLSLFCTQIFRLGTISLTLCRIHDFLNALLYFNCFLPISPTC